MWRVVIIGVFLLAGSCHSDQKKQAATHSTDDPKEFQDNLPEITFVKTVHNFGTIYQGEIVGTIFSFTNTGGSNLLILDASASCGCTVPKWRKEPVPPGGEGSLEVIFDSSGRGGTQNKSVTIYTNASNANIVLNIMAEVIIK